MCVIGNCLCELLLQDKSPGSASVQERKLLLQSTKDLFLCNCPAIPAALSMEFSAAESDLEPSEAPLGQLMSL